MTHRFAMSILLLVCAIDRGVLAQEAEAFVPDQQGEALYQQMMDVFRESDTLSFKSAYRWEHKGKLIGFNDYHITMKKPNFFYMDSVQWDKKPGGILIGDGDDLWIHWPSGLKVNPDDESSRAFNLYYTHPAPEGRHSIAHETAMMGLGMGPTIIDLSIFHGYTSKLDPHRDGARFVGEELVDGKRYEVIEVSYMSGARRRTYWLSPDDHLPRRLELLITTKSILKAEETWTQVKVNEEVPDEMFQWQPPADWEQWIKPGAKTLPPGSLVPDFSLPLVEGGNLTLSEYRGKVVWLNLWRLGCPPCRVEMPFLQRLHEQFGDDGFAVIGLNWLDDEALLTEFLDEKGITFPMVYAPTEAGSALAETPGGMFAVPVNYLIDRDGRVVASSFGFRKEKEEILTKVVSDYLATLEPAGEEGK